MHDPGHNSCSRFLYRQAHRLHRRRERNTRERSRQDSSVGWDSRNISENSHRRWRTHRSLLLTFLSTASPLIRSGPFVVGTSLLPTRLKRCPPGTFPRKVLPLVRALPEPVLASLRSYDLAPPFLSSCVTPTATLSHSSARRHS